MPNPTAPQSTRTPLAQAVQHAFKGLQDWIEVFRSGSHVDSKGRKVEFVNGDLDEMVANVSLGKPPAVLGHPKHDAPAYGWAELKRVGNSLFAKFSDLNKDFEAAVDSGAYRNRSVMVHKDAQHGWRVGHIGWLGAALPALPGLQPLTYSAPADGFEFSAEAPAWDTGYALMDVASALRGMRDHLLATQGQEVADAAIPDWRITSISDAATRIRNTPDDDAMPGAARPFTAPLNGADMPFSQEDLDRTAAETEARVRAELAAAAPAQAAEFAAQAAELQQLRRDRQLERIAAQITGWKAAGQLLPAEEPGLAEFMAALEGGATEAFEFAAAGTATKKTPAEYFAQFVAARGRLVKLGSAADTGTDPGPQVNLQDSNAIARQALAFQAEEAKHGREISIAEAVGHVTRNPQATQA